MEASREQALNKAPRHENLLRSTAGGGDVTTPSAARCGASASKHLAARRQQVKKQAGQQAINRRPSHGNKQ